MTPTGTLPTTKLQKIDLWCGVPVCWLLTLVRRLMGTSAPPAGPPTGKILFIKLAEQGSTVLAQAAIRRAVEMVGAANVFFVVFAENRFILDLLDLIPRENVLTINAGSLESLVTSGWTVLGRIRRMAFESAVDLEFFARFSTAFCFLTGARRRVGFHTFFHEGPYRGDLMTHRLLYNPYLHTSQIFALMVEALRADPAQLPTFGVQPPNADEMPAAFQPTAEEIATVRGIVEREGAGRGAGARLILLNANAQRPAAAAPLGTGALRGTRAAVARHVPRRLRADDRRAGGSGGGRTAGGGPWGRAVFFARGQDEPAAVVGVVFDLGMLVTNDSGPAHFASLTPIHVVTLFGPETPRLFAARTPRNTALWAGVACCPCVNAYNNRQSPCRNNVCMQQISVDQVFAAASAAIQQRDTTAP